ncbi:MAG: LacI family transcriptional regulator [Actinobacteria bacterium]|nr:LacI family transcriptional regulator [Actinomycetota bacterium]
MANKRVTIYDIAKEVGVSASTISRALNNQKVVSEEKLKRIIETVERLGYRVDTVARSLRTKRTGIIGLIFPDAVNLFLPKLISAVDETARKNGYNVIFGNAELDPELQKWYIDMLIEKKVDGVILGGLSGGKEDEECCAKLSDSRIPYIMVDRYIKKPGIPFVGSNNFAGGYRATAHLIEKGHKYIALIGGPFSFEICKDRLDGYKKALVDNGISYDESIVLESDFTAVGGFHCMENLLGTPEHPTAVFIMGTDMAVGAYVSLKNRHINIPDEMAIVGFDDIPPLTSLLTPPLTIVAQQEYQMGVRATKILIDAVHKQTMPSEQVILDVKLIVRNSTDKDASKNFVFTKQGLGIY